MKKISLYVFTLLYFSAPVIVLGGSEINNIEEIKRIIGIENSYVLNNYRDELVFNEYLDRIIEKERGKKPLVRERNPYYAKQRRKYIAEGIRLKFKSLNSKGRAIASTESVTAESDERLIYKIPQFVGLTFFKKNDLGRMCRQVVESAISLKAEGIAFFYPVHFSGGNSKEFSMPKNPVYGKDFIYEIAQAPSKEALYRCIDRILNSNLKINYIPHLESISSLSSSGEAEWRMYSGIPLDDYYYYYSFSPLFDYLKSSKKRAELAKRLHVTFAAEIDNMVFGHPETATKIVSQLRSDLKSLTTSKVPIMLNTNGDFHHLWKIPQASATEISCESLEALLDSIDYLSPSMYGEKGHFSEIDNKLDLAATVELYYERFKQVIPPKCEKVSSKFREIKLGFGEFALDLKKKQNYADILKNPSKVKFVYYWNHSKWDHLQIHPESRPPEGINHRNQLISK